jgi:hypothetical protein
MMPSRLVIRVCNGRGGCLCQRVCSNGATGCGTPQQHTRNHACHDPHSHDCLQCRKARAAARSEATHNTHTRHTRTHTYRLAASCPNGKHRLRSKHRQSASLGSWRPVSTL